MDEDVGIVFHPATTLAQGEAAGPALVDLAQFAADMAGTSMAYIVLRKDAAWHVAASFGLSPTVLSKLATSILLDDAAHASAPDLVTDLRTDPRYRSDPVAAHLRGHAILPLPGTDGALCVTSPNTLSLHNPLAWPALEAIGRRITGEIEAQRRILELAATVERLQHSETALRAANDQLDLDYRGLLDNMADGVLSIGPDQQIEVLNPVGSAILGVAAEAVVGQTLIEAFLDEVENDALVDAVLLPLVEQVSSTRSTVSYRRGAEVRELSVASATYQLRFGPQRGKIGVISAFSDVTEVNALRAAERALKQQLEQEHAKLQSAYLSLEHSVAREKAVTRRSQLVGFSAVSAVFLAIAAVGAYTWLPGSGLFAPSPAPSGQGSTVTVTTEPVSSRIAVVGTIDAGSVVSVVGPFDGSVRQAFFRYGGAVDRGKPLLTMDTADLEVRLRDAEAAEIRANQRVAELRDWATGPEMSRARRTVSSGELDLASLRSKAAQTKMLLTKGIVAADEYTQLTQQLRGQELQLQASRQDLQATADRASEENRRVADFDLANAHAKVVTLRDDLSHAEVLAPVSGVVLQPPDTDSGKQSTLITTGSRVNKGQTMFAVGDLETMSVRAKIDEIDVNKVRVGQSVLITGDALEDMNLGGTVTSVAAQASGESAVRTGMAAFPITVAVSHLTPDQRDRIHVGMSASLSIIAYEKPNAIVIPVAALQTTDSGRTVQVRRNGKAETVPVTLGISTPDGVEIRSGLKAGDVLEVP